MHHSHEYDDNQQICKTDFPRLCERSRHLSLTHDSLRPFHARLNGPYLSAWIIHPWTVTSSKSQQLVSNETVHFICPTHHLTFLLTCYIFEVLGTDQAPMLHETGDDSICGWYEAETTMADPCPTTLK